MPSTVAVSVKCPECGATLSAGDKAETAKCEYCGTVARIQRRTQFLGRQIKLPPPKQDEPKHVAVQARTRGNKIGLAVVLFFGIGVGLGVPIATVVLPMLGVFDKVYWNGSYVIADVDGDGVKDFIGIDRNTRKDSMRLSAFSGKDGHMLWHTPWLGTYTQVYQNNFVWAGDLVMMTDQLAHVDGYDLKTGARRWHVTAPEVATPCAADGALYIRTSDKHTYAVSPADGKLAITTASCTNPPAFEYVHQNLFAMRITGISKRGSPPVAIGYKDPGTQIPMVAALDENGKSLWTAQVPGHDVLTAKTGEPKLRAISDQRVAFVYERQSGPWELTVFDRATGKRLFEVRGKKRSPLSSLSITPTSVAVSTWGRLDVFDVATGEKQFTIGS